MGIGSHLDDRLGLREKVDWFFRRPLPDGPSWIRALIFGVAFLFCFEALTGFLLSLTYSPGTDSAHASVAYTIHETLLGSFLRGLHFHGSSLVLVLLTLIGVCSVYRAAYKHGNEMSWILGLILMNLVFAYTLTGFFLPWDQNAYWGTKVRTSIMGSTPVFGPTIQRVVQGGDELGNLTLTRFYAVHFFLLPFITFCVYAVYRAARNRFKQKKLMSMSAAEIEALPRYWPSQAWRDVMVSCVILAALTAMTLQHPIPLGPPADPLVNYPARPEWFFRWLFQLLKYFDGAYQIIGTLIIPGVMGFILLSIPFLDRSDQPGLRPRKAVVGVLAVLGLFWTSLTSIAYWHDIESGHFEEVRLWEVEPNPDFDVEGFYRAECYECHGRNGAGLLDNTPDFTDADYWASVRSDVRLLKAILDGVPNETLPEDERMPGYREQIDAPQAKALIEFKLRAFLKE